MGLCKLCCVRMGYMSCWDPVLALCSCCAWCQLCSPSISVGLCCGLSAPSPGLAWPASIRVSETFYCSSITTTLLLNTNTAAQFPQQAGVTRR